jgi:hypothetical protein
MAATDGEFVTVSRGYPVAERNRSAKNCAVSRELESRQMRVVAVNSHAPSCCSTRCGSGMIAILFNPAAKHVAVKDKNINPPTLNFIWPLIFLKPSKALSPRAPPSPNFSWQRVQTHYNFGIYPFTK